MNDAKEQVIFVLTPESKWSNFCIYPARVTDKGEYYLYLGRYSEPDDSLPKEWKQIVDICRSCEAAEIYMKFGKKFRSEQQFLSKMDEKLQKTIRAYVDKQVYAALENILLQDLPIYLRENRWDNPYKKNKLELATEVFRPLLSFKRNDVNVRYELRLLLADKVLKPLESGMRVVTEQIGLILYDNKIYQLADGFSGTRIKPFLQKNEIIISRDNEAAYFRTFILKNIGNVEIEVEGFDIVEPQVHKQMILLLENDLLGNPVMDIRFKYNGRMLLPSNKKPYLVDLREEEGTFRFFKLSRDFVWEKEMQDYLLMLGMHRTEQGYWAVEGCRTWADVLDWLKDQQEGLDYLQIAVSQEKLVHPYYSGGYRITHVKEEAAADWFQVKAEITLDNGLMFQLKDLWKNILERKREYLLSDGTIFIIPEEWFARYSGLLLFARQGKSGAIMLKTSQTALLDKLLETQKPLSEFKIEWADIQQPVKLKGTLRDYQQKGYRWLYACCMQGAGACLADDMGLGKTMQTISLLLKYKEIAQREPDFWSGSGQMDLFQGMDISAPMEEKNAEVSEKPVFRTCLIVAPASVEHNWRHELQKFAPSLTVSSYVGVNRSKKREGMMRWDVVTTTYQTMRNDIDFFMSRRFGFVILDEAQMFKNKDSLLYQAVKSLNADYRVALTGTPIENSLGDLWALMDVINPGLLGSYTSFQKHFIRPVENAFSEEHLKLLNKLVHPFILRRTKSEVLQDLPERTDEIVYCEQLPEQKRIYDEELSKARNLILEQTFDQNASSRAFNALQAIGRLRQLANEPRLLDVSLKETSGKFQEVFRMLDSIKDSGHKVLLFSDYVKYLDLVAAEMDVRGWKYAKLVGVTRDREQQIGKFSQDADCQFFLISLKAGGVGINLTEADYVFILDPWWNTAAEEQAIGRAHRIGQKQAVFVYRFVTTGTLEERILEIQRKKSRLSEAVIAVGDEHVPLNAAELENLIVDMA